MRIGYADPRSGDAQLAEHEPVTAFKRFIAGWGAHNGQRVISAKIIRDLESYPYWQPAAVERRRSEAARPVEAGVAQKVRERSGQSTPETAPAAVQAVVVEQRPCKPCVPGSSPGPSLDGSCSAEAPFAVGDEVKARTGDPTMFGPRGTVLETRDVHEILVRFGPRRTDWHRAEHFAPCRESAPMHHSIDDNRNHDYQRGYLKGYEVGAACSIPGMPKKEPDGS